METRYTKAIKRHENRRMTLDYKTLINRPRTVRGRETLNRIVSAAAQEIYENGYHNASINEITRKAGVAAGTFYVYFDSKYNLYKFLLLQCSHNIRKHLNQATKDCRDRREVEEVGLREWLKFVQQNQYMYHIIWESLYVDKQLFVDYYTNFCKAYVKGIDAAKERGEIRTEINSEVLAWTLMGASNFLGLNWGLFTDSPMEHQNVVDSFMQILGGSIFTDQVPSKSTPGHLPIRIEVEFDDDEEYDETAEAEELEKLEKAAEITEVPADAEE